MKIIFNLIVFIVLCLTFSFADTVSNRTVITGDIMEIKNSGEIIISRGNSKAVNGRNTIKAKEMTYNKKRSLLSASGNVGLFSKTDDNEPIEAFGSFAKYDINSEKGKLWGDNTKINYYMKDSKDPLVLDAQEIYIDRNMDTLSAFNEVKVITSSGIIYSDNAVYNKKDHSVLMQKDKKRPIADIVYDERKGLYEADKMIFYNSDDKKKIIMSGEVKGKIEMEDEIK